MFQSLSQRLTGILDKIRGRGVLTETDVDKALREIRVALLEADVALPVAKRFIESTREKAIGQNIIKSVSPGQMIVKIVHDQLIEQLGTTMTAIQLSGSKPHVILMAGLQGSGKTTTTAKLALHLKNRKVLMVSLDVSRPAAQEQLAQLGKQIQIATLPIIASETPLQICERAKLYAAEHQLDCILFDTAGRMHIDQSLMDEIKAIKAKIKPCETLLVADAMTGQDAVKLAQSFHEALDLTGIILTRIDGDARGGAALSMRAITGRPIKFMGTGESLDKLEVFDAERVASRILDMGDIVGFVEKASQSIDQEKADAMTKKIEKGRFDLNDMAEYLQQMQNMGGLSSLMKMMPGMGQMQSQLNKGGISDNIVKQQVAIIRSMTKKERRDVTILNASRRRRIASGSCTEVSEVNRLLKQYEQVKAVLKQMGILGGSFSQAKIFSNLKNMLGL